LIFVSPFPFLSESRDDFPFSSFHGGGEASPFPLPPFLSEVFFLVRAGFLPLRHQKKGKSVPLFPPVSGGSANEAFRSFFLSFSFSSGRRGGGRLNFALFSFVPRDRVGERMERSFLLFLLSFFPFSLLSRWWGGRKVYLRLLTG